MKIISKTILSLSLLSSIILIGCSSHSEIISISETHTYNNDFGLNNDVEVDNIIEDELREINMPTQQETPSVTDPTWTTDASIASSNTFLEDEYVQQEPIITYKYKFDEKFYDTAEWRKEEYH